MKGPICCGEMRWTLVAGCCNGLRHAQTNFTIIKVELVKVHAFYKVAVGLGFEAGQLRIDIFPGEDIDKEQLMLM